MKIWLDDMRPAPDGWVWVKTAEEAISHIRSGKVSHASLDHDLGTNETGYTVACAIEQMAAEGDIWPFEVDIHSANPVGRDKMSAAILSAYRLWGEHRLR